jgi:hypothetical protein
MNLDNLRIHFCEYTNREVVQEKFSDEWICIHEETEEQELENIVNVNKLKSDAS